jgi:2-polyprenyl-3-methyl-5-hydroxy-6-metoxy-1,4-benzoquinol methylase
MRNVNFTQSDEEEIPADKPFDAAVGRYTLMFLPTPISVLRSISQRVRSGGSWLSHVDGNERDVVLLG